MLAERTTRLSAAPETAAPETAAPETAETLDDFARLWRRLIPPEGVSMTAGSTLGSVLRAGPLRLSALAEREAVSQPAMTGLVTRLEAAGYVSRTPDPSDGRAVLVALTQDGRALIEQRRARRAAALGALLDRLDPQAGARITAAVPALRALIAQHDAGQEGR